jgi:hypothetical protein
MSERKRAHKRPRSTARTADSAKRQPETSEQRLLRHIDEALGPAGVLTDLSRIIAQFARGVQWAEDRRFRIDADGMRVSPIGTDRPKVDALPWALIDVPIGQLPPPPSTSTAKGAGSSAAAAAAAAVERKDLSSLRVWTIRIDRSREPLFTGILKPTGAPKYNPNSHSDTYTVGTHHSAAFRGMATITGEPGWAYTASGYDAAGSRYQFTADLAAGTVRVRPILPKSAWVVADQQNTGDGHAAGRILAKGIADLADYRAGIALAPGSICSLLFE